MNPVTSNTSTGAPRRRTSSRRWLPYLGAILLIALIVIGLWPQPAPVEITRVVTGRLQATVNEEGRTRVRQRYQVSAPVAGQLRRLPWKPGAEVKAGVTVLAVIDPLSPSLLDARARSLAEARRDAAVANLAKAETAHTFAASELGRFERLFKEGTVSIQELEGVQWREAAATRDRTAAESALRQVEAELAEAIVVPANPSRPPVEVKSPTTGRVLRVVEESARVVAIGAPLLEIGDPTDLEIVIDVLSRDGAAIAPGTRIELDHWGGATPLEARVRLVEPGAFTKVSALGVEEQRVNLVADLTSPPDQRPGLGDGFRVEAKIIVWETENTLKVPAGALFRHGSDWAALVVDQGRAQLRKVTAGRSSGSETQILDGLKEGDEVILYPGDRVHTGDRVRPMKV